jgi:hypothetical protein
VLNNRCDEGFVYVVEEVKKNITEIVDIGIRQKWGSKG